MVNIQTAIENMGYFLAIEIVDDVDSPIFIAWWIFP